MGVAPSARNPARGGSPTSATTRVGITPRSPTGFGIAVRLEMSLPGLDRAVARSLVDAAHSDICPCSHAMHGNVEVALVLL